MSLKQFLRTPRGQFPVSLAHSFNVAAICALGVWHGYLFRIEHAAPAAFELKLMSVSACAPCSRAPLGPNINPNPNPN